MKLTTKRDKRTNLEKEIDEVLFHMSSINPGDEPYAIMATNLETLYKAKATEKSKVVSPDTIAVVAGNILGLVLILVYEETRVISTKALGFVLRSRV